ncbi:MAG: SEC-C domain-containing protein [candidate division WOR-3 bacterium]
MNLEMCPCGSGKPLKKCCYENWKKSVEVIQEIRDMNLPLTTEIKGELENFKVDPYPTYHQTVFERLKTGKIEIVEIYEYYRDMGFADIDGRRFWSPLYEYTPLEKRPFFVFNFDGLDIALPSAFVARSVEERLATMDATDEESFLEGLKKAKNERVSVEGYGIKDYTLLVPLVAVENLKKLLHKTQTIRFNDGSIGYFLYMTDSDHRNFKRALPSPKFSYIEVAGVYSIISIENTHFLTVYSHTWPRSDLMYQNIKDKVASEDVLFFKYSDKEIGRFSKPDEEPKPKTYKEIADFYSNIEEYEYDGKPLGRLKEEDKRVYNEILKTFAFIEAQLSRWKAPAFPYKSILKKLWLEK